MAEIIVAPHAGFCRGVTRAVDSVREFLAEGGGAYIVGELIHNRGVNDELRALGLREVAAVEDIPRGARGVIRSHGMEKCDEEALRARCGEVLDATCPFVRRIHDIVRDESACGRNILILGDAKHPEVRGISSRVSKNVATAVASDENELKDLPFTENEAVSVVAQTTLSRFFWDFTINFIKNHYTNAKIFDTICRATNERQSETAALATECDAMVVIGDRGSSNTAKLAAICGERCQAVVWIDGADGLQTAYTSGIFKGCGKIGITAGASVPLRKIEEVKYEMSEELKDNVQGEESFAELLEQSIKTLHTGERVIGTVTAITPTEVQVDLGTKHAGFIQISEMTDDPSVKVEDMVKVGDQIEVFVVKVNDAEGTVMLSKKKIDSIKGWEDIENFADEKVVVEGPVVEINKGGVLVSVNGVRVFVPASQTGMPRDADMTEMLKKKVKLLITEVTRGKRRVVGSIRRAASEERKAAAATIWETIEVGKKYHGTVKSITDYGVFVDIGGVDGMVHMSELSWSRIKHPSDVVKVGDEIDVYVISYDPEKKKISLGHKDPDMNPWQQFVNKYGVGDIAEVRIVKLMPFGAFAEIVPGVDGLIHISQIADHRIARPSDVVEEGQTVMVKILEIDDEHKKISLSMRQANMSDAEIEDEE